jgi:hypothetical protein
VSLPFYSNSVTITPGNDSTDKWEPRTYGTPVTGVPCILSDNDPVEVQTVQGDSQTVATILHVETNVEVTRGDQILDEDNGDSYEVVWVHTRTDRLVGFNRKRCGLIRVEGING